jgi:hypothetical protein
LSAGGAAIVDELDAGFRRAAAHRAVIRVVSMSRPDQLSVAQFEQDSRRYAIGSPATMDASRRGRTLGTSLLEAPSRREILDTDRSGRLDAALPPAHSRVTVYCDTLRLNWVRFAKFIICVLISFARPTPRVRIRGGTVPGVHLPSPKDWE